MPKVMYLRVTDEQYARLANIATYTLESMASIVRKGVDRELDLLDAQRSTAQGALCTTCHVDAPKVCAVCYTPKVVCEECDSFDAIVCEYCR